jgi:hypothetical protein
MNALIYDGSIELLIASCFLLLLLFSPSACSLASLFLLPGFIFLLLHSFYFRDGKDLIPSIQSENIIAPKKFTSLIY